VIAALEAGVEQLTHEVAALTEQVKTTEQADGQVYLDESAVTPVAICEYCKQGEKPGDKMWEGANGSFIHDSCIFDSQPVAMD
jgi:hypothetical protein